MSACFSPTLRTAPEHIARTMAVIEPAKTCPHGAITARGDFAPTSGAPPATLFSVPPNLLDTICAETDTKGRLSLARTCKALNLVAEARLLRNVDICLDTRIADEEENWTDEILDRGHDEHCNRLKGLLVALQSEPRRVPCIRSLRVTLWKHSIKELSKLLVLVSGSVQSLCIDNFYLWGKEEDWGRLATEILSFPQRPSFAGVRDLDLSCPIDILAKLLHLMPKVESIRLADFDRMEEEEHVWPNMSGLRRFSVGSCNLESICPFLKRCPALVYLDVDGSLPHGVSLSLVKQGQWLIDNLMPLPRASRLVLSNQPVAILATLGSHHLPALQDLKASHVVKCPAACRLEFIPIPNDRPHLKILRLHLGLPGWARCNLKNRPTSSSDIRLGGPIPQTLIEQIDSAPSLESLRLSMRSIFAPGSLSIEDKNEDETWCGASISTLVYGTQTVYVVHSRTTSRSVPYRPGMEDDEQCISCPEDAPFDEATAWYGSTDPVEEVQTDFLGELVPLEIIDAMARLDGVPRWRGRGIQVSTAAWQVLLDWYAQVVAGRD